MLLPEVKAKLGSLVRELDDLAIFIGVTTMKIRLAELEEKVADGAYDKETLQERAHLSAKIANFSAMQGEVSDCLDFALASDDEDADAIEFLILESSRLASEISRLKVEVMFSGQADGCNAFVEINAGAGGTDSQDWAQMLERIYLRWAELRKFSVEILHRLDGESAGIKQSILRISGKNAYGWLKSETGVHRLVRISPFNAQAKRQTSFSSVLILPDVETVTAVTINAADLRIDTFRSSGAGGQHVNTTDSAVRLTHLPTGIVVSCQNGRSQHKNREEAMKILLSRLYDLEERKKRAAKDAIEKDDIAWGNQIKNYVLHPYKLVKDARNAFETSNADRVLDGDIDDFLLAAILTPSS